MPDAVDLPADGAPLRPEDLGDEPFAAFRHWWQVARESADQPDAMALATAMPGRGPAVRIVLLRGFDERGFVFFTNRESAKGADLAALPRAALAFHWTRPLHRQVRVEGVVELVDDTASEAYYRSRPAGARISAWASPQSQVVPDRADLERRWREFQARFDDRDDIPRPPFWGGYRVVPHSLEFWQGRQDRLHDRVRFRRDGDAWVRERLAP